jgi:hypothetical protein
LTAASLLVALFASITLLAPVADPRKSIDDFVGWLDFRLQAGATVYAYDAEVHPIVGSRYREIRSHDIGDRRSLSLWELKED